MIISIGTFLTWDNFSTVYFRNEGSFVFPLKGIGAKYGESVSTKSLSNGMYEAALTKSKEFLENWDKGFICTYAIHNIYSYFLR